MPGCKHVAEILADSRCVCQPIGNSYGSWSGSRVLQNLVPFSRVPVQCTFTMLPFCTWHPPVGSHGASKRSRRFSTNTHAHNHRLAAALLDRLLANGLKETSKQHA